MRILKNKKNRLLLANFISIILIILFVSQCFAIVKNLYTTYQVNKLNQQLSELKSVSQSDWSHGMKSVNEDYVGWLTVYGTNISLPVVQGDSNEDYLRRSIYGEWCEAGTVFLDKDVNLSENGNFILYGHLMNDGTMFAELSKFKDKEFIKDENNRIIQWECESGTYYYKVFAAMIVPGDSSANGFINFREWINKPEPDAAEQMIRVIEHQSFFYQSELFRKADNQFLFLTTCDYSKNNMRLVVVAELIGV